MSKASSHIPIRATRTGVACGGLVRCSDSEEQEMKAMNGRENRGQL